MRPETVNILTQLNLSAEQWAGVVRAIAEEQAAHEAVIAEQRNGVTRSAAAVRQQRYRDRKNGVTRDVTDDVTRYVTGDGKESFPHTPFKENTSSNLTVVRSSPPTLPPQPSKPDDFERFWAVYPPREGSRDKAAARKAFTPALLRTDLETILDGAARYRAYVIATNQLNTRYVKQARTWLNGNGWQENYDVSGNTGPGKPHSISGGFEVLRGAFEAEERAIREEEQRLRLGGTDAQVLPGLRKVAP